MTPDLSVVVVSWNARALLADCLASLRDAARSDRLALELLVVDNASTDGSPDLVRADFPEARLIPMPANVGFARAANAGLRAAAAPRRLLLNSDTRVPAGALRTLVAALDARPDASAVGPLLVGGDGRLQPNWARFPTAASEWRGRLDRGQAPVPEAALDDPAGRDACPPFPVDWIGGACLMVRADAVARAGGLDERFFFFGEDVLWCRALGRVGPVLLVPGAVVVHLGGGSRRRVRTAARRWLWWAAVRVFFALYGPLGGLPGALVATGRWLLSPLRPGRDSG